MMPAVQWQVITSEKGREYRDIFPDYRAASKFMTDIGDKFPAKLLKVKTIGSFTTREIVLRNRRSEIYQLDELIAMHERDIARAQKALANCEARRAELKTALKLSKGVSA
ncbi:MAG: hypothetical protein WC683_04780 [bacterium]|jgi:hypothetical protein